MARKNIIEPVSIASAQSLAANFTSNPTCIDYLDNIAYQINVTTSDSTGTFTIEGSLDYVPSTASGPVANSGNWVTLSTGGDALSVAAADVSMIAYLNQLPFKAIRVKYTSTIAGTGTCNILLMAKEI